MQLVIRYADKETRANIRIEKVDVPFKTKQITLQEMDACDTIAYRGCESDEVLLGWKLEEDK